MWLLTSAWLPRISSFNWRHTKKPTLLRGSHFRRLPLPLASKPLQVCCSSDGDGDGRPEEAEDDGGRRSRGNLFGDGGPEEAEDDGGRWSTGDLFSDEGLLQDLNAAVDRVAKARRELEVFKEQENQASLSESLESANSLVEACQRDVFAAELDLKNAEIALVKARAGIVDVFGEVILDKYGERMESAKAAGISGMVGCLAGIPFFSLMRELDFREMAVSAVIIFVSCAVFGLTYRYAVRRDLTNTQLRAGCTAAFALVRCLGQVDAVKLFGNFLQQDAPNQLLQGGLYAAESVAIFSFAAVGLEYCFRLGFVSPFPLERPK